MARRRQAARRDTSEALVAPARIPLYDLADVHAALGAAIGEPAGELPAETEHQSRLAKIIRQGEAARWRSLLPPQSLAVQELAELTARAPHLSELGGLVERHLRSAAAIGLPTSLPPLLIVGAPGVGKSWFLSRLASILGLPFKRYSMAAATLGEGLQGAFPSWRNAQAGLVARTLLAEKAANPVLFVDEADKGVSHAFNGDPFRPLYSLLDAADSTAFVDEYLGFPMDASHVVWIMAANDASLVPAPIADRLTILNVPVPDAEHRARIAISIYAEANIRRRGFFDDAPSSSVVERLADMTPRATRKAIEDAMVRCSAEGRRSVRADDVRRPTDKTRNRIGFCR